MLFPLWRGEGLNSSMNSIPLKTAYFIGNFTKV